MLHRVVCEHKATLFAQAEARSASGRGYPGHVRDEFDKYERCGILAYGVVSARCQTCGDEQVVGFSCKRKTLCCRATAARWLTAARDALGANIRRELSEQLEIPENQVDSIVALVTSRVVVSLERLLS